MKRIISIFLTVVMIITLVPIFSLPSNAVSAGVGSKVLTGGKRDFKWPVPGNYGISSCFTDGRKHCAIDIVASTGTRVVAAYDGTVIKAVDGGTTYYGDGFGNYVVVQHSYTLSNGNTATLYTRYSHLNSVSTSVGAKVYGGTTEIGRVGNTGNSTGPHLDFQILYGGWQPYQNYSVDPYVNELLELPTGIYCASTSDCCGVGPTGCCCYYYIQEIKKIYATPLLPTNVGVQLDKSRYNLGDTVTITPSASGATNYSINIWYGAFDTGERVFSKSNFTGSVTYTPTKAGEYAIRLDAQNSAGYKSVDKIFSVIKTTACINYYDASGEIWKSKTVDQGDCTLCADYPKKDGYYFCGWSYTNSSADFDIRPTEAVAVSSDLNLYPVYVSHERVISGEEVYIYNIEDFTEEGYDIQSVERTKETRIDTSYWSSWSAYSATPIASSSTVQVRTVPLYRYYYYLCPSCGAHEPFYGTSDCGATIPQGNWHEQWSTVPYSQSNYKTFSYTTWKYYTTSLGDGQIWIFSSGNLNDTAIGTKDSDGSNDVIKTGYSFRTYIEQYKTVTEIITGYTISVSGCHHNYEATSVPATCSEREHTLYTCVICGNSYKEYADDVYSDWSTTEPTGVDASLVNSKTQYRYSDYETKTSYSTSLAGYTQLSGTWEQSGSGTIQYVKSWPSGFYTGNGLYSTYNKSPRSAAESATAKTTINSDRVTGYIYYHWCRGAYTDGPIDRQSRSARTGEYAAFHAFYSTTAPGALPASSDGDGSYKYSNGSCCKDSYWYFYVPVYTQTYTTYNKLFTYCRWTDWSDWGDTPYSAGNNRKVETRTVYRYVNAPLGDHVWDDGAVTTPATCTAEGVKTYTCTACGETRTERIAAAGHDYRLEVTEPGCLTQGYTTHVCNTCDYKYMDSFTPAAGHHYRDGVCTNCGDADPAYQVTPVTVTVGTTEAQAGQTVTVPVRIENNNGFAGFTFSIGYDSAVLTLTDVTKGEVLQASESGALTKSMQTNTVTWVDSRNSTGNGVVLYLTFRVANGAQAGSSTVTVSLKDNNSTNFVDETSKALRTNFTAGAVAIRPKQVYDETGKLVLSSERARAGDEVTVSVSIEDNPGIMVMVLGIDYDKSRLELIGHEDGILTGWTVVKNAVWIGDDDSTSNGVILKLKFRVLDNAEDGDAQVTVLYSDGDIANHMEETKHPAVEAGKVTVCSVLPGDLTGDGSVNALDLLRLKRHLAGENVELATSADLTGDGSVNALDLLRLKRHLAGEDVVLH